MEKRDRRDSMHPLFEHLFRKLVHRWGTYQDAPRDPELVTRLATARADLDDTRREIADVRERLYPERHLAETPQAGVAVDPGTYRRLRASFQNTA
jgi:hypothetical protein